MRITKKQLQRIIREAYGDWGEFKDPASGMERIDPASLEMYIEGTLDSHPDRFTFDDVVNQFEQYYNAPKEETQEMLHRYINDGFIIVNPDDTLRMN